jgi:hypothetical protein
MPLTAMFHLAARRMRGPYLRLLAELGRRQPNPTAWWASSMASRRPAHTDFFVLLCAGAVVCELAAQDGSRGHPWVVFVEDPWLFAGLKEALRGIPGVRFESRLFPQLGRTVEFALRGTVYRALLGGYLVTAWMLAAWRWRGRRPAGAPHTVGMVSFLEARSVQGGRFSDPYLGRLDQILEAHGFRVLRLLHPLGPLPLLNRAARLEGQMWPLVAELRPGCFARLLCVWRPDTEALPSVVGLDDALVRQLMRREVWREFSGIAFNLNLVIKDLYAGALVRCRPRALVYYFENQAWEKMMCLVARTVPNIRIVGHQHSIVPWFLFTYFLGDGEREFMPLPDRIVTNGPYTTELLREAAGFGPDLVVEGGTLRYEHLVGLSPRGDYGAGSRIVLVALPSDASSARTIVAGVVDASRDPRAAGWKFVVKPHPDLGRHKLGIPVDGAICATAEPIARLLNEAEVVVASESSLLEAWLRGKRVIRVRYEHRVDLDLLGDLDLPGVVTADEDGLSGTIVDEISRATPDRKGVTGPRRDLFFSALRPEVWLRELGGVGERIG